MFTAAPDQRGSRGGP